ncbi:hypothetical protein NL676_033713 [Syzygium grande]|nr:hypothetical protein NL676_033713 [Syzygium grande]
MPDVGVASAKNPASRWLLVRRRRVTPASSGQKPASLGAHRRRDPLGFLTSSSAALATPAHARPQRGQPDTSLVSPLTTSQPWLRAFNRPPDQPPPMLRLAPPAKS